MLLDTQRTVDRFMAAGMSEQTAVYVTYAIHDAVLQARGLPLPTDRPLFCPPEIIERRLKATAQKH